MKTFKFTLFASILILFLLPNLSYGQAPTYINTISKCFGGSLKDEFFGGSICLDGGYLLTGVTVSTDGDIDPFAAYDSANIFVVKTDPQGNKEWAKTFGGNGYDKARYGIQDSDSCYVIVGTTHSFDGDVTYSNGNTELCLLKLDKFGNKLWMKQYGGTNYESGRYVAQISDGNYLIAGYTASKNFDVPMGRGGHDGWLLKVDTGGVIIWSQTYGGTAADRIRHFTETADGGFVFAGSSVSNNLQCTGNSGGTDVWVGKVDSAGNLLWSNLWGGSGEDYAYHTMITSDGNYLVTGFTQSNNGDVTNNYGSSDGWLLMVDSAGNLLNQKTFGGTKADRLYSTYETSPGSFMSVGFAQSKNFDLSGVHFGLSKVYWLINFDSNLDLQWGYTIGGTGANLGKELIYDPSDSSVVMMGDSDSNDGAVIGNHGDFDLWLVKLEHDLNSAVVPVSEESVTLSYHSPSNSMVIESPNEFVIQILAYDMLGRRIFNMKDIKIEKGNNVVPVTEISHQASGIITISVLGLPNTATLKVPVIKY